MKVLFFANTDWYLYNFRRPLIKRIQKEGNDVIALIPQGKYFDQLEQEGISCLVAPISRRGSIGIADLISLFRLFLIYWRQKPDVVHHFTMHASIFGMICAKLAGVPYRINAVTGMGYFFTGDERQARLINRLLRSVIRWLFIGKGTHVVVQNRIDAEFFSRNRLSPPNNLHLIEGSGINMQDFAPAKVKDRQKIRVLMASRILVDKGVREYVELAKSKQFSQTTVEFLLAGDIDPGNPSSITPEEFAEWAQIPQLSCLGYVSDMSGLLNDVDIFVLPSYREGLPRSLLEASAAEIPIVTTDVPGCNEVVIDGVNGLLVPVRSTQALADAIVRLLADAELRKEMGRKGRERVAQLFSEKIVLEKTSAIYGSFSSSA